jgi:hypothetical protein
MGPEQDIVKCEKVVIRAQEPQPAVGAVDHVIDESSGSDAMRSGATVRWAARRGSNRRLAPEGLEQSQRPRGRPVGWRKRAGPSGKGI